MQDPRFKRDEWPRLRKSNLWIVALPDTWERFKAGERGEVLEERYRIVGTWPNDAGATRYLLLRVREDFRSDTGTEPLPQIVR